LHAGEFQNSWFAHFVRAFATRPFAIAQLFSNLVGNAVTHGAPERPIRVRATTQDGKFELSVANAGEPIASEAMERLFQPFYRGG
jgi:sigma-B regulation protein RsbU (phosphoserine phosphatase)